MSLPPANPAQKKILKEFCNEEFKFQTEYLILKYALTDYKPQFFLNFRTNAAASYGGELADGEPFISVMAMEVCDHVGKTGKFVYEEYDFLKNKAGIGSGEANWKQHISWTIAHELAHTLVEVERFRDHVRPFFSYDVARDIRGHGLLWQSIYRDLRVGFCREERYSVLAIDFSKSVWHSVKRSNDKQCLTFYRGDKEIGWYIRSKGIIYKSNRGFDRKTITKYQKPGDIYKRLVTV